MSRCRWTMDPWGPAPTWMGCGEMRGSRRMSSQPSPLSRQCSRRMRREPCRSLERGPMAALALVSVFPTLTLRAPKTLLFCLGMPPPSPSSWSTAKDTVAPADSVDILRDIQRLRSPPCPCLSPTTNRS